MAYVTKMKLYWTSNFILSELNYFDWNIQVIKVVSIFSSYQLS